MMINLIKQLIIISTLILSAALLSGCSSMNSNFDCPNKPGVTCRSLDQVNDMVDHGLIGRDISIKPSHTPSFCPIGKSPTDFSSPMHSLRSGEQVVQIWVAPYQDVHNNYHNESTLYTVVRKNNWAVPTEIKE